MELGLKGKIALVTGSSRGLGKAIAESFAKEGTNLLLCSRHHKEIEEVANQIKNKYNVEALSIGADVSKLEDIEKLVKFLEDSYGKLDILVTNAGGPPPALLLETSEELWFESFNLTLMSVIRLTKKIIPIMKRQNWGRIINMTSVAVKQPIPGLLISNTLRAAVVGFAKTISLELAQYNITVNNVCPGYTLTERLEELAEARAKKTGESREAVFAHWIAQIPLGRLAHPNEIASLVVFLASELASYITGATIPVDGGYYKGLL